MPSAKNFRGQTASAEPNAVVVPVEGDAAMKEVVCTVLAHMFFAKAPQAADGPGDTEAVVRCNVTDVEQKWCVT